ncbi:hypothetical protein QJS66_05510 [Kocuria rhizophila]|nr:hypothetical protein QJS66_05510 [Kocuria rhizophila]
MHFIGMGGADVAVARAAAGPARGRERLRRQGLPGLRELESLGAHVFGQDAQNVAAADTVVVSTAIKDENPNWPPRASSACGAAPVPGARGRHARVPRDCCGGHARQDHHELHDGGGPARGGLTPRGPSAPTWPIWGDAGFARGVVCRGGRRVGRLLPGLRPADRRGYATWRRTTWTTTAARRSSSARSTSSATIRDGGVLVACADDPGAANLAARRRAAGHTVVTYAPRPTADVVFSAVARHRSTCRLAFHRGR